MSYLVVRTLLKRSQQQKSDDAVDSSKQSSSLLCTGVGGNGNSNINTANHTDTITKVYKFSSIFKKICVNFELISLCILNLVDCDFHLRIDNNTTG